MLPLTAGHEETRTREGEMGLDLLLGLRLLPPTLAAGAAGGSAAQQRPYEKTTAFDEPLSFAAATDTASATMRACVRRRLSLDVDDGDVVVPAPPASILKPASSTARWPPHATSPTKVCVPAGPSPGSWDRSPLTNLNELLLARFFQGGRLSGAVDDA